MFHEGLGAFFRKMINALRRVVIFFMRGKINAMQADVREKMHIREMMLSEIPREPAPAIDATGSVGVHLHLYYPDMLERILSYLKNIPVGFDLFVSVVQPGTEDEIRRTCSSRLPNLKNCFVETVPNRGRDVAPLICTFGERLKGYGFICHIHTKRSSYSECHEGWAEFLYTHLLGSEWMVKNILSWLSGNVSVVYPPDFLAMENTPDKWLDNLKMTERLLKSEGIAYDLKKEFPVIEFSQGTMFWARGDYLAKMLSMNLKYEDFPEEPIKPDGTIAHALERTLLLWDPAFQRDIIQLFLDKKDKEDYSNERF